MLLSKSEKPKKHGRSKSQTSRRRRVNPKKPVVNTVEEINTGKEVLDDSSLKHNNQIEGDSFPLHDEVGKLLLAQKQIITNAMEEVGSRLFLSIFKFMSSGDPLSAQIILRMKRVSFWFQSVQS